MLAEVRLPVRWRRALPLAVFVYGGAASFALAAPGATTSASRPGPTSPPAPRSRRWRWCWRWTARGRLPDAPVRVALVAVAFWFAAIGVVAARLAAGAPRKIAGARAAFVTETLEAGRRLLDFDGDGYARRAGRRRLQRSRSAGPPGRARHSGRRRRHRLRRRGRHRSRCRRRRGWPPCPTTVPPNLDLLLVTIDTLRADHLGCYGYPRPTSPVIDALAAEGALFENGWAHAPSTRYSMPAIAAGRWPSAITWDESIWWPRLGPDVRTTGAGPARRGLLHRRDVQLQLLRARRSPRLRARHRRIPRRARGAARRRQRRRWSRAARRRARSPTTRSRSSTRTATGSSSSGSTTTTRTSATRRTPRCRRSGRRAVDGYDGEIRFTDLHLGRLLAHLRAVGLWDRTAIILTGDHGEGFGEHGVTEHGFDLYPAQTKVPFIVRVPGRRAAPGARAGRAHRHRADAAEPGARHRGAGVHRPFAGVRRPPVRPRPTPTRGPCSRR